MATTNKQIFLSFLAIVCGLLVVAAIRDADAAHSNRKDLHGGKCPRVKPSCCIMQFVNHEIDADFKESEECPLDCCAAPGGAGRHDRRLARQFRNRFLDFLQCFSKLLVNFWKPGYSMPESCCTKFMTFRLTPFCRSKPTKSPAHSSTSTTGSPQSTSTSTKAPSSSQSPTATTSPPPSTSTTTTTTKASDSSSTPSSTSSTMQPASSSSVAPASAAPSGPSTSEAPDSQTTKEPQTTTKSSVKRTSKSKNKSHETHTDS